MVLYNDHSDIDLVCYGKSSYERIKPLFDSKIITPYIGSPHENTLYARRMIHMTPMDFELLIKQESRKLQGVTKNNVHINCQPLRHDSDSFFQDWKMIEVGEIICTAEIINNTQGIYAPAFYEIKVIDILQSLFSGYNHIKEKITSFISFIGAYSGSFTVGDKVFLDGKLIQIETPQKNITFGVELTPFNTKRLFTASLLE